VSQGLRLFGKTLKELKPKQTRLLASHNALTACPDCCKLRLGHSTHHHFGSKQDWLDPALWPHDRRSGLHHSEGGCGGDGGLRVLGDGVS